MYNDYDEIRNHLAHFGISGQKKGTRRFQSYAVAPTRSGMVGQEVGEAAKQRSRLTNIAKGAQKQVVRTALGKHNPALTMANANHNFAYRANKYKLGNEQKRLDKAQQSLDTMKNEYQEKGLDTYAGKNPFKNSARKKYEHGMTKAQGKIYDAQRKVDKYSKSISDSLAANKKRKGPLNKLDDRIADTLDKVSENSAAKRAERKQARADKREATKKAIGDTITKARGKIQDRKISAIDKDIQSISSQRDGQKKVGFTDNEINDMIAGLTSVKDKVTNKKKKYQQS